ncbi:MAG TPA: cytochrome c [Balneolaceae bacterium]|nr:cytochrome c [Balneolaceae bacterium]
MTKKQRQKFETSYDSVQSTYKRLMAQYQANTDSLSPDLQSMYTQMQQMHSRMQASQQRMMSGMSGNMGGHMQGNGGMMGHGNGMGMGMNMQMREHMTGEWFQQMMAMHAQMAAMHMQKGQTNMAQMNRRLSKDYQKMMDMTPGLDKPLDVPEKEQEEEGPSHLNGEALFTQNCASCHGSNAAGMAGIFPPLINSEWVTQNPSVPVRILLNGLSGQVKVNGQTYQGVMPSFRARLGDAEIAAILNYLRSQSNANLPDISQDDVLQIRKKYKSQTQPWQAPELRSNLTGSK